MTQGDGEAVLVRGRARPRTADGLRRERLLRPLLAPARADVVLVVAPAGCGKTTLLSHLAEGHDGPVGWLTLDHGLGQVGALLAHLQVALEPVLDDPGPGPPPSDPAWATADDMLAALDLRCRPGSLVVLDDVHAVRGTPSVDTLDLLVARRPQGLRLALASRTSTGLDMWRPRLRGQVATVDADALRFRTWEVEKLFQQGSRARLRPQEAAILAQRTGGWAAGLQLFDLATARMPPSARVRLLRDPTRTGLLTRDYLMEHVVAGVPADLRDFALRSSVLVELTAERCSRVLDVTGAEHSLQALARLGLVSRSGETAGTVYSHHDVLRQQLLAMAAVEFGEAEVARLHRRAGEVLRAEGRPVEAVQSLVLANDWEAVAATASAGGQELAAAPGAWLDLLPAALRESDPWLSLAIARRLVADGDLSGAVAAYARAEALFGPESWGPLGRNEASTVASWVRPPLGAVDSAVALVRRALADPADVLEILGPAPAAPRRRFARGLALLVSGRVDEAAEVLGGLLGDTPLPAAFEAIALLGQAAALSVAGDARADLVRGQASTAADLVGSSALQRLAEGLDALASGATAGNVAQMAKASAAAGDVWGNALLRVAAAVATLPHPPDADLDLAFLEQQLTAMQAGALAVWVQAARAVARRAAGHPPEPTTADLVRRAAAVGPLPHALALLAAGRDAEATGRRGSPDPSGAGAWLRMLADRTGGRSAPPVVPSSSGTLGPADVRAAPALHVRCLGGFGLARGDVELDPGVLRPRHRALLRALSLHAGSQVHREQLIEWFWPGQDPERATRNLQVAVSAVRRFLAGGQAGDGVSPLRRDGEGYGLDLGGGDSDVGQLWRRVTEADRARRAGDAAALDTALRQVVAAGAAEVLPEDGPAEWVVAERERVRQAVVAAAGELAESQAATGRHADAVRTASLGLRLDAHADRLWATLVSSLEQTGRPAEAALARQRYEAVLGDLAVVASAAS